MKKSCSKTLEALKSKDSKREGCGKIMPQGPGGFESSAVSFSISITITITIIVAITLTITFTIYLKTTYSK